MLGCFVLISNSLPRIALRTRRVPAEELDFLVDVIPVLVVITDCPKVMVADLAVGFLVHGARDW